MFIQPLLCFDCNATVNYCSWLARVLLQHQFLEYLAKSWRAVGECESSLNNKNTNTKHIFKNRIHIRHKRHSCRNNKYYTKDKSIKTCTNVVF